MLQGSHRIRKKVPCYVKENVSSYDTKENVLDNFYDNHVEKKVPSNDTGENVPHDVDINDVRAFMRAVQTRQPIDIAFDLNGDSKVDILDVRFMMTLCTRERCAA